MIRVCARLGSLGFADKEARAVAVFPLWLSEHSRTGLQVFSLP